MTKMLMVNDQTVNLLIAGALLLGTPFFLVFGQLSDKIGRKRIILAGCLIAALTYIPLFKALTYYANPAIFTAQEINPVTVIADPASCSFQFDPIGKASFTSSCDVAKSTLAKKGINYSNQVGEPGAPAQIKIGQSNVITVFEGTALAATDFKAQTKVFDTEISAALTQAGYPKEADSSKMNYVMVLAILTLLVVYVTMVYGPIAAYLVELFPTRIRYTSMSLPYHIGNGWFGGFLPTIAFAMVATTGDIYYGLWYPIGVALFTFVIGLFFLPETRTWDLDHHDKN